MSEQSSGIEDMKDILHEFVVDSKEMLEDIEPVLIELEADYDEEKINKVFRCFHSIKGGAGFLNLNNIQRITHSAETLLDLFRKGKLEFGSEHLDIMVLVCDQIVRILDQVYESLVDEGFEAENETLCQIMDGLIENGGTSASKPEALPLTDDLLEAETAEIVEVVEEEMEIPITDEMVGQFVQEAEGGFEKIEEVLLILEKFGFDQQLLDNAYRLIHSFKGNCGFMNFKHLELVSHKVETVFDGMKNKEIPTKEENVTILFQVLDVIRATVQQIGQKGSHVIEEYQQYLSIMDGIIDVSEVKKPGKSAKGQIKAESPTVTSAPTAQLSSPDIPVKTADEKATSAKQLQTDIRVNLSKVDKVINLVGELMIISQMITSNMQEDSDTTGRASHQLNSLITELQDVAMSIRMIPLAGTFRKMVRLVRDLSKKSGKQVQFETKGEDTELDKTVVEQISDPLVHLVRNSIDHGIEPPDEREALGKSPVGK
ncbi:MAG: hypothetical protein HN580_23870, partial [Deltaproteobacteria bacterium]|nr:hypothetical protein [Deltaproteobacteria bacterium]